MAEQTHAILHHPRRCSLMYPYIYPTQNVILQIKSSTTHKQAQEYNPDETTAI